MPGYSVARLSAAAAVLVACNGDGLGCGDGCVAPPDPLQPPEQRAVAVAAGFSSSCALTEVGALFCWGENRFGEIGDSTRDVRPLPTRVHTDRVFGSVTGTHGTSRVCATDADSQAYCWGYNLNGELGDGTSEDRWVPTPVGGNVRFRSLATSYNTCGVGTDHRIYCWPTGEMLLPLLVASDQRFQTVGNGMEFSCALTTTNAAYCWGWGDMLGNGSSVDRASPYPVAGGHSFVELSVGEEHTCGLEAGGALYCWGKADGWFNPPVLQPKRIPGLPALAHVSAGDYHTCALTPEGLAYCWATDQTPRRLTSNIRFAGLASGQYYSCGYTPGGATYCWSVEFSIGLLGDSSGMSSTIPVRVAAFP